MLLWAKLRFLDSHWYSKFFFNMPSFLKVMAYGDNLCGLTIFF